MKKFLSIAILSLLTGMSTAHAGFLLDPYFSYAVSGTNSGLTDSTMTGSELGARLGWDMMGLGFGVDGIVSGSYTYKQNSVSSDIKPSYYGVFVSYKFPIVLRGYVSYLLSSKETMTVSGIDSTLTGTGTKVGIQYTGFPFVAIGVEYVSSKYDKVEFGGLSITQSNDANHTAIALSFPFVL